MNHLGDAVELVVPQSAVIHLERIVVSVLAGPEFYVSGVQFDSHLDGRLPRSTASDRIWRSWLVKEPFWNLRL